MPSMSTDSTCTAIWSRLSAVASNLSDPPGVTAYLSEAASSHRPVQSAMASFNSCCLRRRADHAAAPSAFHFEQQWNRAVGMLRIESSAGFRQHWPPAAAGMRFQERSTAVENIVRGTGPCCVTRKSLADPLRSAAPMPGCGACCETLPAISA